MGHLPKVSIHKKNFFVNENLLIEPLMELWKLWLEKRKTNTAVKGLPSQGKTDPDRLPVGDEEQKGKRGNEPVDEEDHEQIAHDIPEM